MKKSGVAREEIFLETKPWPAFYEDADVVDKTLTRLNTDYVDLLLIHQPAGNYIAGYKAMEKTYKEGKVRAIGLSNFNVEQIKANPDLFDFALTAEEMAQIAKLKTGKRYYSALRNPWLATPCGHPLWTSKFNFVSPKNDASGRFRRRRVFLYCICNYTNSQSYFFHKASLLMVTTADAARIYHFVNFFQTHTIHGLVKRPEIRPDLIFANKVVIAIGFMQKF